MLEWNPLNQRSWPGILLPLLLVAAVSPAAGATETPLSDAEIIELVEAIEANTEWAREGLENLKSDHLDRAVLLASLDYNPDAIKNWIADNTLWVPYSGRLRGADGVLMDRRGNSLDRSLLLSALLEDAGVETRLARAELSTEAARRLLVRFAGADVRSVGPELEPSERLRALYEELDANSRSLAKMAGLDHTENPNSTPDRLLASTRDHWWVQKKDGARWVDLDPLFPGDSSIPHPAPRQTFSLPVEVPPELQHSLRIAVVIERWEEGELFEEVALTHELAPTDAVRGHTLELDFNPFNESWLDDDSSEDADPFKIANEAELWLPILKVDGTDTETGEWVSKTGNLVKDPTRWVVDKKMGQATKALSALGNSEKNEEPTGHLTAVWLEYEIRRPGDSPRTVRRELSDILGVDRRDPSAIKTWEFDHEKSIARGFDLQTNSIALVTIAMPQRVALEQATYQTWIDNRSSEIAMVYLAAGREDERIDPSLRTAKPYPIDLLGMMTARGLWSRHPNRLYQDEINIWSNHLGWPEAADSSSAFLATDIVANHVGAMASSASEARMLRIEQGMLDTFIEQHLAPDESGLNAYGRFVVRDADGRDWSAMTSNPRDSWPPDLPSSEAARLATTIEDGARVVVSDEIVELGDRAFSYWWQMDPGDGTTLGIGYRGWGVEYSERGVINVNSKVFDAAQKRGIVTRACKIGSAIVKIVNVVTVIENPVMIDIDYVIELERRSLYVTQQSSGGKICP